jgi:hypothetical protein
MFIDLEDYAHTAEDRGWGTGWPRRGANPDLATVVADRSGTRIAVRTALATLICTLIDWTEREDGGDYLLKPGDCGGCDRHPVAVTSTAFNHSWAVDVDINRSDNPFTMGNRHDIPTHVARVWNRYGFAWGGDYRGPKRDWMHFEFMGTPADAIELSRTALRELAPASATSVVRVS